VQSLDASLKRLNTDYVDLLWIHAWDFTTHADEVMRALDDLVRLGKILYVGASNTPAWVIARANTIADLRGWTPFVGLQIEYNLVERSAERDLLPMANSMEIGVCPWGILAAGVLTGKYGKNSKEAPGLRLGGRAIDTKPLKIAEEVIKTAKDIGCRPAHVAINWVRKKPGVVSPVVGARTAEQVQQNIECLKYDLTDKQMEHLNKVSEIELGYPHEFLNKDVVREMIYGAHFELGDSRRC
jgi:aryl-alcohol dehydrogenase-like predicted oxidoreductase